MISSFECDIRKTTFIRDIFDNFIFKNWALFLLTHTQVNQKIFENIKRLSVNLYFVGCLPLCSSSEVMLRDSHLIERPNQRGIVKSKQQQLLSPCHRSVVTSDWR